MTKKEMKKWAVKKWQWIIENWDYSTYFHYNDRYLKSAHPELSQFHASCSFCAEYKLDCPNCPLSDEGHHCCKEFSKWREHQHRKNKRWGTYWAKKMLAKIKAV